MIEECLIIMHADMSCHSCFVIPQLSPTCQYLITTPHVPSCYLGVLEDGTGDGNALLLPSTHLHTPLPNLGLISLGQGANKPADW
jgi:hypothetical protein